MKKLVQVILLAILVGITSGANAEITTISTDGNFQENVQEALILAAEGDVIQLPAGTFSIKSTLSLDVDNVTVVGAGMDKTILSYKTQDAGSEGLIVTSSGCTLKDFSIEDAIGDAIKVKDAKGIKFLNVRTAWTNGPKSSNGAYGMYPVGSTNVLIDGCVAVGASDAGIYVGQSKNVIVRNSRAEFNVAGIEIENCYNADVYNCVATRNTGGILVFDLPNLPQQGGHNVRIFNNKSFDNDTENFAPAGNIVGNVPTGTGILVMANRNVDIFENELSGNGTTNIMVSSYMSRPGEKMDPNYIPNPQGIHIHHNTFGKSGYKPMGIYGDMMTAAAGTKTLPNITWDGRISKKARKSGKYSPNAILSIHDNGDTDFVNLDIDNFLEDPATCKPTTDLSVHSEALPAFPGVTIDSDGTD
jgi:parallel beta-helix repeat protein